MPKCLGFGHPSIEYTAIEEAEAESAPKYPPIPHNIHGGVVMCCVYQGWMAPSCRFLFSKKSGDQQNRQIEIFHLLGFRVLRKKSTNGSKPRLRSGSIPSISSLCSCQCLNTYLYRRCSTTYVVHNIQCHQYTYIYILEPFPEERNNPIEEWYNEECASEHWVNTSCQSASYHLRKRFSIGFALQLYIQSIVNMPVRFASSSEMTVRFVSSS